MLRNCKWIPSSTSQLSPAITIAPLVNTTFNIIFMTIGACIVALGEKLAGMYTADNELKVDIENAAKRTDEGIWHLPLEASYKENIKSSLADIKNLGAKGLDFLMFFMLVFGSMLVLKLVNLNLICKMRTQILNMIVQ